MSHSEGLTLPSRLSVGSVYLQGKSSEEKVDEESRPGQPTEGALARSRWERPFLGPFLDPLNQNLHSHRYMATGLYIRLGGAFKESDMTEWLNWIELNWNKRNGLTLWNLLLFQKMQKPKHTTCPLQSFPGTRLGRSSGERNGYPFQYSCLENPMDRGAWWATDPRLQSVRYDWANIAFTFQTRNSHCSHKDMGGRGEAAQTGSKKRGYRALPTAFHHCRTRHTMDSWPPGSHSRERSSSQIDATQLKSPGQDPRNNSLWRSAFHRTRSFMLLALGPGEAVATQGRRKGSWWVQNNGAHLPLRKALLSICRASDGCASIAVLLLRLSPNPQNLSAETHLLIIREYTALGAFPFHSRHLLVSVWA